MEKMLEIRRALKRRKPIFLRQDSHKKAKLGQKWRRPKGSDSKMRRNLRGYRKGVTKGYKSPSLVRGLTREGKKTNVVANVSQLAQLNTKDDCVIVSGTVGMKKKAEIVKLAVEKGFFIGNIRDAKLFLEEYEKKIAAKKEEKTKHIKEKEKKDKEKAEAAKKKEEEREKEEKGASVSDNQDKKGGGPESLEDLAEEEKKKEEDKKEMDKVLTKKSV